MSDSVATTLKVASMPCHPCNTAHALLGTVICEVCMRTWKERHKKDQHSAVLSSNVTSTSGETIASTTGNHGNVYINKGEHTVSYNPGTAIGKSGAICQDTSTDIYTMSAETHRTESDIRCKTWDWVDGRLQSIKTGVRSPCVHINAMLAFWYVLIATPRKWR